MPKNLKEWSAQVRERDGKCMDCGSINDLHAHHIKHKVTHPELILDLSNGKTLCYRCHKAEHERNRPPRIRSDKPNRKTLLKQIAYLEDFSAKVTQALMKQEQANKELAKELRRLQRLEKYFNF